MSNFSQKATIVLQENFGHQDFRSGQLEIIEHVLAKKHSLVLMPTSGGKSLCFQLPALMLDGLTLVISPLIALMKDQVDALKRKGIDAEFINSSLDSSARNRRYENLADGRYKMLYVTPERFLKDEFREAIARRTVELLAIDEAHCVSSWGHDFRPDYTRVGEFRKLLNYPTTIALTATATPKVQKDIIRQMGLGENEVRTFAHGIERPNLTLEIEHVWGVEEKLAAIENMYSSPIGSGSGSGIVYFALIKTLDYFSERLAELGIAHRVYNGGLAPSERRRVQDAFMNGTGELVLATNAFGMGVDKEDIRYVLHAEVPGSLESYYQEIGRAGRDGEKSICQLLYDQRDLEVQMQFIKWSNPGAEYYKSLYLIIDTRLEEVNAFGLEWLRERMHHRDKFNRTLETALGMLERHGVITGDLEEGSIAITNELPETLANQQLLDDKLKRDQKKLYALVEYAKYDGDHKKFIEEYFGL